MIDIHSHILPFVDDGASDWEISLEMARQAVDDGIKTVIATPHHANGKYVNEAGNIRELLAVLHAKLSDAGIALEVLPGQEIRAYGELLNDWESGKLLPLADSRYILLEFSSSSVPATAEELIYELAILGIRVIIAHPERCSPLAASPNQLRRLIEAGAFSQLTAQSLSGDRGRKLQKISFDFLKEGLAHFVATDAHDLNRRPFILSRSFQEIEKQLGKEFVHYLYKNAENLVKNREIRLEKFDFNNKKNVFANFFLGKKK